MIARAFALALIYIIIALVIVLLMAHWVAWTDQAMWPVLPFTAVFALSFFIVISEE